jgi:steroid delta-isomerase-like uncharacterized protein
MSIEEENKAILYRFFEELNKGNLAVWDELCVPGYIYHGTAGDMTREQSKDHAASLLAAFPDLNGAIDDMVAEGDRVVARYTVRGTHQGTYGGLPPTGKQVTLKGIEIDKLADGKFIETWTVTDTFGLLQQLGVIPSR